MYYGTGQDVHVRLSPTRLESSQARSLGDGAVWVRQATLDAWRTELCMVCGWLSKSWSLFGSPKYQVPYSTKDPNRDHNFDNHSYGIDGIEYMIKNFELMV